MEPVGYPEKSIMSYPNNRYHLHKQQRIEPSPSQEYQTLIKFVSLGRYKSSVMWPRGVWRVNFRHVCTFRVTSRLTSIFSDNLLKTSNSASHHSTGTMFDICYSSTGIHHQPWNSVTRALFLVASCHRPRQLTSVSAGLYMWVHEGKWSVVSASTDLHIYYQLHQCRVFIQGWHDFWRQLKL